MGADTGIEWTDATWTPIRARRFVPLPGSDAGDFGEERIGWHCEKVSAACKNCYAEPINRRLGTGLDYKPGHLAPRGDVTVFLDEKMLLAPLKWRKPRMIFVCSMTDLFADFVTDEMIDRVFAVMALCPQHTFQVLTKRPERMHDYMTRVADRPSIGSFVGHIGGDWDAVMAAAERLDTGPLPNVWLGVSAEDQDAVDARVSLLLATPAAVRFVSVEPMLGLIDLLPHLFIYTHEDEALLTGPDDGPAPTLPFRDPATTPAADIATPRLDWVICGGESGPGARPMHPDWARALRDQCAEAQVPFFFKQWGEFCEVDTGSPEVDQVDVGTNEAEAWRHVAVRPAWIAPDGQHFTKQSDLPSNVPCRLIDRIGKKAAGRRLDGLLHDGMPS